MKTSFWFFANVIGVVMGFVFVLLTTQKMSRDERLLVIMGTALIVGGICFFLRLSALYTAMIMGIVVGNYSRRRVQVFEQLLHMEKTIYIAFLILLGAWVSFAGQQLLAVLALYLIVRLLTKIFVSGWALPVAFPEFKTVGRRSGLVFTAQGGVALAIALDYGQGFSGPLVEVVVAVVALAVVTNEFIGVVLTQRAFRASGDAVTRKTTDGARTAEG